MMQICSENVSGWEAAIRGMRNPMNSWDKSDSGWGIVDQIDTGVEPIDVPGYIVGENDLKLMKSLSKAGNDHGKFLRMINVTCDITAPLYWWKEFSTYKVGTVANSCSTMHKIHAKEFTLDDFSHEHLTPWSEMVLRNLIVELNESRNQYLHSKKEEDWWQMIQLLPSSYNQKRTVQLNYQVLKSMYYARKNHKLYEWREFCDWMKSLPYFEEICIDVVEE